MMKNVRCFDYVYTVPINVVTGVINNASTPIYFSGYPFLRGKRIKAINVNNRFGTTYDDTFFTFVDGAKNQLLYNYPASDLLNSSVPTNQTRLRLFDLYDIDLNNSYWINTQNIGWAVTGTILELNFYY